MDKEIKNSGKLILLHLLPGVLLTILYIVFVINEVLNNYPKLVVFSLAGLFSIVPFELGYLFYVARKETGNYNIFKVLGLKQKMKIKAFILYALVLFILTGIIITIFKPVSDFILNNLFGFIPSWYNISEDMSGYSQSVLVITILISFFFITLLYPIIEELYFRGFLLARMSWMGKYSVLLNIGLFAVYHFWTPWLILARVVAFLPLFYFVYKKKSLKLGITVHCLANFTDTIALIALL